MRTVAEDGWPAVRMAVFQRDGGCIANRADIFGKDVAQDHCRNNYARPLIDAMECEFDHVKEQQAMGIKAPDDEAHGVAACAWHHRLSQAWRSDSAAHRGLIRRYLARLYPAVWQELLSDAQPG